MYKRQVKDNLYVCPRCGGYFRMHAYRRIEMLIDEGTFEEWDKEMSVVNPLAFQMCIRDRIRLEVHRVPAR